MAKLITKSKNGQNSKNISSFVRCDELWLKSNTDREKIKKLKRKLNPVHQKKLQDKQLSLDSTLLANYKVLPETKRNIGGNCNHKKHRRKRKFKKYLKTLNNNESKRKKTSKQTS